MDYNIEQNEIFVEDNLLGIMEIERKVPYIDIVKRLDWSRPQSGAFSETVFQVNFNLAEVNHRSYRQSYTYLEALGDVGGVFEACLIIFAFLISPFYFKIHHIEMFREYLERVNS